MEYTAEITITTEILENYRADKIAEEKTALTLAQKHNLQEGIGIHGRQISRLHLASYKELFRWFVMDAAEQYA